MNNAFGKFSIKGKLWVIIRTTLWRIPSIYAFMGRKVYLLNKLMIYIARHSNDLEMSSLFNC